MSEVNLKFTAGWDWGYCGAEPLTDGAEPFYANTEFGTIILDGNGMALFEYDESNDKTNQYTQTFPVDSKLANFIVAGLEVLTETQFENWVESFKSNEQTEIEVY